MLRRRVQTGPVLTGNQRKHTLFERQWPAIHQWCLQSPHQGTHDEAYRTCSQHRLLEVGLHHLGIQSERLNDERLNDLSDERQPRRRPPALQGTGALHGSTEHTPARGTPSRAQGCFLGTSRETLVIRTLTKLSNLIGYQQPDLSSNRAE